jgi:uncharacterized OB-fold protein
MKKFKMVKRSSIDYKPTIKRVCTRCGNKFLPTGKYSKICEKCYKKRTKWVPGQNRPYYLRINDKGEIKS